MLDLDSCVRIFRALSNPHRLQIFLAGVEAVRGGPCVTDVSRQSDCQKAAAECLGIGRSTMSYHIRELTDCGLVKVERDGQKVSWSLDPRGVALLREFMNQIEGSKPRALTKGRRAERRSG